MSELLNERAQHLLKTLIERYISDGQPVSSKTLAEDGRLSLSPASVRNVLADLEDRGYIASPHTSAGRVPTPLGYRFFIDTLLTVKPLDDTVVHHYQPQLSQTQSTQTLLLNATTMLSELSKMAGLVSLPKRGQLTLSSIEFLPLSDNRILVILILNGREIQNRIIHTKHLFTRDELTTAATYLNNLFSGKDLLVVRNELLNTLKEEKKHFDQLMQNAIDIADKAFQNSPTQEDYMLAGQANLVGLAEETNLSQLRDLFEKFTQKHHILHLLDQCLKAKGVQIFIGGETTYLGLGDFSLVTSTYSVEGQPLGVLGVIGPSRMPYDKIISIVDVTGKLLSAALTN